MSSVGPAVTTNAMAQPLVSVIIPVFRDSPAACLLALQEQSYTGPIEVIVVNNGVPGELDWLMPEFPSVVFVDEPNPGSYTARNAGMARAVGSILAFTDSDCAPDPDWLASGVRHLATDARCGLVGGRVRVIPRDPARISVAEAYDLTFGFRQRSYVEQGRFAVTANMMTRSDVVGCVGPFRGDLFSGGDADWGRRVAAAGYALVYDEDASVRHPARDYRDLIGKLRRAAAGERDRNPDWASCLRACLRRLAPLPRDSVRLILKESDHPTSTRRKLALFAMVALLRWRTAFERLRLQVSGSHSPRA